MLNIFSPVDTVSDKWPIECTSAHFSSLSTRWKCHSNQHSASVTFVLLFNKQNLRCLINKLIYLLIYLLQTQCNLSIDPCKKSEHCEQGHQLIVITQNTGIDDMYP